MIDRPLHILLVDPDRALLRHLSRFLKTLGHRVSQVAEPHRAVDAVQGHPPDILIVSRELGEMTGVELARHVRTNVAPHPVQVMLLVDGGDRELIESALAADVDDFLTRPVVYGEVLSRIRAGARMLELERRLHAGKIRDRVTHMQDGSALAAHLEQLVDAKAHVAMVMLEIDFLDRIEVLYGRRGRESVLRSVSGHLRDADEKRHFFGYFGDGRFGAVLGDVSEVDAAIWAEHARREIQQAPFAVGEGMLHLTVSVGVAYLQNTDKDAETIIRRAESCLHLAQESGRNCIARQSDLDSQQKMKSDMQRFARLFEETTARDVMLPAAVVLPAKAPLADGLAVFRQSAVSFVPTIDDSGRYAGVLTAERLIQAAHESSDPETLGNKAVAEYVEQVACFEESARFEDLKQFFSQNDAGHLVIVKEGLPTGLVTRGLLSTLTERLTLETFAPGTSLIHASDDLRVPEWLFDEEEEEFEDEEEAVADDAPVANRSADATGAWQHVDDHAAENDTGVVDPQHASAAAYDNWPMDERD